MADQSNRFFKDSKIGSSLKKIIKEEVNNDDEKALKEAVNKSLSELISNSHLFQIIKLFTKAQKKEEENAQCNIFIEISIFFLNDISIAGDKKPEESKPANGNSTSEQPKKPEAEEQKAATPVVPLTELKY